MEGIIDNLENALNTWSAKLAEIWSLLTQDPESFRGGTIWGIIVRIHGSLKAIGLAMLVLFFLYGIVKETTSLKEVKRPETGLKLLFTTPSESDTPVLVTLVALEWNRHF